MRTMARLGVLTAALICTTGLAGCRQLEREIDLHFAWMHQAPAGEVRDDRREAPPARVRRAAAPEVRRVVAKPQVVPAGNRIRQFCGQRHSRYQTGHLGESAQEKARNDVLCSQS